MKFKRQTNELTEIVDTKICKHIDLDFKFGTLFEYLDNRVLINTRVPLPNTILQKKTLILKRNATDTTTNLESGSGRAKGNAGFVLRGTVMVKL